MKSPFAAGMGPGGARTLYVLGLLAALKAAGLLGAAEALAHGLAALAAGKDSWSDALTLGFAAALVRAAATWLTQWYATRASLGAKEALRAQLTERTLATPDIRVGEATTLATRGLNDLDPYFRTVLPTTIGAAVIPLAIGTRILFADWLSAFIVVLTVPLIPVFMILIGQYTRDRVDAAAGALSRLADHLVELAQGLPVLVGLGRVVEQSAALHRISEQYRTRTLSTLRTAFLSSLALELIATISVAVVAVTVGIRLVHGNMDLEIGLLVLILAPECYTPLREVGVAFHASQDGVAALERARVIIDRPHAERTRRFNDASLADTSNRSAVSVSRLTVRYKGRDDPAINNVSFDVAPGEVIALTGPSGSGKSTVLRILAGRLDSGEEAEVSGTASVASLVAWLPQHPATVRGSVREELQLYAGSTGQDRVAELALTLGLNASLDQDPAELSPGELRRLAFARALLRVDSGAKVLLLDEPTAHLDPTTARTVEKLIAEVRTSVAVLLVSHDPRIIVLANRTIPIDGPHSRPTLLSPRKRALDLSDSSGAQSDAAALQSGAPNSGSHTLTSPVPMTTVLKLLGGLLRPVAGRLVGAVLLGALAALSAAALTAVSGWLIVRAAEEPAIMYLLVAIVGVRFFGLARSVLRYSERLITHDAVFGSITTLRDRLWSAIATRGTASPALRRASTALEMLVVTADQVRDLTPRVLLPPLVALVTGTAAIITVNLLYPSGLLPVITVMAICLLLSPTIALAADRHASADEHALRATAAHLFTSALGAADDLSANGVDQQIRADLAAYDTEAGHQARRSSWAVGLGQAVTVASLGSLAIIMLAVTAPAVITGSLPAATAGVLALLPLGLIDPMLSVVEAVQQWPALVGALRRLAPVLERETQADLVPDERDLVSSPPINEIALERIAARWPEANADVFSGVTARVGAGEWLAVSGPSGSGKTTLLSVLLRYLDPVTGNYSVNGRNALNYRAASVRRRLVWCPQEAHLFASTIRGNLLLGRASDDRPGDAEMLDVLRRVGLGPMLDGATSGLDTLIGGSGTNLSGGERQRLAVARALLSRAEIVLLDEPTAHLDAPTAAAMMTDLRNALADRTVVLVSHRNDDFRPGDHLLNLRPPGRSTANSSCAADHTDDLSRT